MSKILLINPPAYFYDDNRRLPHMGLLYLQASLLQHGHICTVMDATQSDGELSNGEIMAELDRVDYDMVGISILFSTEKAAMRIGRQIKAKKPLLLLCAGGIHGTICHKELLEKYDFLDVVMRGEGEETIVRLADALERGEIVSQITGCSVRQADGTLSLSEDVVQIADLDALPFPVRTFDPPGKKKLVHGGENVQYVPVSSSRGCVYHCSFCCIPAINNNWRKRSPDNVAAEVRKILLECPNPFLVFIDDNFLINVDRALEIARKIAAIRLVPFSFATRSDQIVAAGEETMKTLARHGCASIEIGLENGSNTFLSRMNKKITAEINLQALALLRASGITASVDYILFDPDTTLDELVENLAFFRKSSLYGYYPPRIYNKVFPYPGAAVCTQIPDLSRYFKNSDVAWVYNCLQDFKRDIQPKLSEVILGASRPEKVDPANAAKIMWYRIVPYLLLEKLLYCERSQETYEEIVSRLLKN